jgi:hypothetical protein
MNPLQIGAAVGLLVAAGGWCIAVSLQRAPRSLVAVRLRMYGAGAGVATRGRPQPAAWTDTVAAGAPGRWVAHHFGSGLDLLGFRPVDVVTRVLTAMGVVVFAVLAAIAALLAVGVVSFSPLWPAVAAAAAVLAARFTISDIEGKAEQRRRALRRAANDFVQLVAVGLTTDQSVEEAVRFALSVASGDGFDLLRAEVATAPQRGVPVWEALDELGRRFDLRELGEFAASIERQGLQGVSISDTVASLAASMRAKALDDLEREADRANANLAGPTIGFVVTTIVFLAYPLAQRISEAFGG